MPRCRLSRSEYARTGMRPSGPTRKDRAFVELVTQLEQLTHVAEQPFHATPSIAPPLHPRGR